MGNKKPESPQANFSEWAVGGWSQLFGLGGGLSQEAGKAWQLGQGRGCLCCTRTPPWRASLSPPSLVKATLRSGRQTSPLGQHCGERG